MSRKKRGTFLVLEGPDGCGKSSMLAEIKEHLRVKNKEAVFVRDPGGTVIGGKIRQLLLDPENVAMCPTTELLLYAASRAQLVNEVIRPALEEGKLVISDRFYLSTLVYQGVESSRKHGRLTEDRLREIVRIGVEDTPPDHIFLLDAPAEVGLARVGNEKDRMEQKGLVFFEEVRQRYLGFADGMGEEKVSIIDADRPILEVKQDLLERLDAWI